MYLVAIMDWYSRRVLSWRVSNTLDTHFFMNTNHSIHSPRKNLTMAGAVCSVMCTDAVYFDQAHRDLAA